MRAGRLLGKNMWRDRHLVLACVYSVASDDATGGMVSRKTNGPGWNVVLYCRLSEAIRAAIREGRPVPSVELLRRFETFQLLFAEIWR